MVQVLGDMVSRRLTGLPQKTYSMKGRWLTQAQVQEYFTRSRVQGEIHPLDPGSSDYPSSSTELDRLDWRGQEWRVRGLWKTLSKDSLTTDDIEDLRTFLDSTPSSTKSKAADRFNLSIGVEDVRHTRAASPLRLFVPETYTERHHFFKIIELVTRQDLSRFRLPTTSDCQHGGNIPDPDERALELRLQKRDRERPSVEASGVMVRLIWAGCHMLNEGKTKDGFATISEAFSRTSVWLRQYNASVFSNSCLLLIMSYEHGHPKIGWHLARHLYQMSRMLYGPEHSLTIWFKLLFNGCHDIETFKTAYLAEIDSKAALLGKHDPIVISSRANALSAGIGMEGKSDQQCRAMFESLLHDYFDSLYSRKDVLLLMRIQRGYATILSKSEDHLGAEQRLIGLPDLVRNSNDPGVLKLAILLLRDLAQYIVRQGEHERDRAAQILVLGVQKARASGLDDSVVIEALRALTSFCQDHDFKLDAAQYGDELSKLIEPFSLTVQDDNE